VDFVTGIAVLGIIIVVGIDGDAQGDADRVDHFLRKEGR
jgi:hypothetical protein